MITYISILRGINVSGKNIIKMDALRKLYTELGFANIQTYIQSGNVVFQDNKYESQFLEKKISSKIFEMFNFEVPVLVLKLSELKEIANNNPFLTKQNEDLNYLHVTFLSSKPSKENIDKIQIEKYIPDEFIIIKRAIYLFCPKGYGNTKLSNKFFENKLKVTATTRNWKTINELSSIADLL